MTTLSPLATLLRRKMTAAEWRPSQLQAALAAAGADVTLQAVLKWLDGGGADPKYVDAIAAVVGVSANVAGLAVIGRGEQDAVERLRPWARTDGPEESADPEQAAG